MANVYPTARKTITNLDDPQQIRELNRQMDWIWRKLLGNLDEKSFTEKGINAIVKSENNLTTEEPGHVLDARQGKVLKDILDNLGDPVAISHGGTSAKTPAKAKANLGFGTETMNPYISAGVDPVAVFVLGMNVGNENSELYGKRVGLVPYNNGIGLRNITDDTNLWAVTFPAPINLGGTGADNFYDAHVNLGMPFGAYADASDWSELWENCLSKIPPYRHAILLCDAGAASLLSNGIITGVIAAVIFCTGTETEKKLRVLAMSDLGSHLYSWTISNATSSSRTTGTIYEFAGSIKNPST